MLGRGSPLCLATACMDRHRTFSSTSMASLIMGIRMALAMKPGESLETTTSARQPRVCSAMRTLLASTPKRFSTLDYLVRRLQRGDYLDKLPAGRQVPLKGRCCSHHRNRVEKVDPAGQTRRRGHAHPTTRLADPGAPASAARARRVKDMELVFEPSIAGAGKHSASRVNRLVLMSGISGMA